MTDQDRWMVEPARQGHMITRAQFLADGGSGSAITRRLASGQWIRRQAGVYQIDRRDQVWIEKLWAATLAAGPGALVSHRAALVLWGLDGISAAPPEITVGYSSRPIPQGVVVHRTRRPRDETELSRIPITTVERTLLDCAALLPAIVLTKALDSALRQGLATMDSLYEIIALRGTRGVRGVKLLARLLSEHEHDVGSGSPAESEILHHMRLARIPDPSLQHELVTPSGRRVLPDFYWPILHKAVEIDGLDAHSSADMLDDDLRRQNELLDMGIDLRRFSARRVRRDPKGVVAEIEDFLSRPTVNRTDR